MKSEDGAVFATLRRAKGLRMEDGNGKILHHTFHVSHF